MVMWLVTAVNKEQRAAIFEYFKNPSMEDGKSREGRRRARWVRAAPAPASSTWAAAWMRPSLPPKHEHGCRRRQQGQRDGRQLEAVRGSRAHAAEAEKKQARVADGGTAAGHRARARRCKPFKDQLLLDITPEGLRIQIVDAQNRPMFDLGGSHLKGYTARDPARAGRLPEHACPTDSASPGTPTRRPTGAARLHQLGPVGRSRQRRAPRAGGRRPRTPTRSRAWSACPRRCCSTRRIRATRSIAASASS